MGISVMPSYDFDHYNNIADRLKDWLSNSLPAGGLVKLDGTPGIGKNTLVDDYLTPRFQGGKQRIIHIDLDGFAQPKEIRRKLVKDVAKEGTTITDEFSRIYQVETANKFLSSVAQWVGSHGDIEEARSFILPGQFIHGGSPTPPRSVLLRRGDWVVVDAEYVHLFDSLKETMYPSVSLRLCSSNERVEQQWMARTKAAYANDPEYLAARLKYHQLATLPSVKKYEKETAHLVDLLIRIGENTDFQELTTRKSLADKAC